MSPRKFLRIGLSIVILVLIWRRLAFFTQTSRLIVIGTLVLLIVALIVQLTRKPRNLKNEVPKRPLGLDD